MYIVIWDFGVYAAILQSNGDFAPLFLTLRFYPRFFKMKLMSTPGM